MWRKPLYWMIVTSALLLAPLGAACRGPSEATPAPTAAASPAVESQPTPGPAAEPTLASEQVTIDEAGLSILLPQGWERLEGVWAWSRPGAESQRLGVAWGKWKPGQEPEALLLPKNAVMAGRTEGPEVSWGQAATYRLQVMVEGGQGAVQAAEAHVLVRAGSQLYDLYASGATEEELVALEALLGEMVASAALTR